MAPEGGTETSDIAEEEDGRPGPAPFLPGGCQLGCDRAASGQERQWQLQLWMWGDGWGEQVESHTCPRGCGLHPVQRAQAWEKSGLLEVLAQLLESDRPPGKLVSTGPSPWLQGPLSPAGPG